jgi:hypothetical protein
VSEIQYHAVSTCSTQNQKKVDNLNWLGSESYLKSTLKIFKARKTNFKFGYFFSAWTSFHSLELGFRTCLIDDCSRGIDGDDIRKTFEQVRELNGAVIQSHEVIFFNLEEKSGKIQIVSKTFYITPGQLILKGDGNI